MRSMLVLVLLAATAVAQDQPAITAAVATCGPKDVNFDVKADQNQHPVPQPDSQKALVYVVQEFGQVECRGCAVTKIGLDGVWVGANKGNSYIYFFAEPGERHLCMNWQSRFESRSRAFAVANFTAEAGKTYYYRARVFPGHLDISFDLDPINSDQGKLLVASSALSVSAPKGKAMK
jgi:hypothetical protein